MLASHLPMNLPHLDTIQSVTCHTRNVLVGVQQSQGSPQQALSRLDVRKREGYMCVALSHTPPCHSPNPQHPHPPLTHPSAHPPKSHH